MRAIIIVNPISGDDEPNEEKVSRIQTWLARGPFVAEVAFTSPQRGAGRIAREAVHEGVRTVIAAGGDGTVSEVARELVNTDSTLGILPIGTFNNIARSIGVPTDLPIACSVITEGHFREVDIGEANGTTFFFEAAGAGLDAALFPLGEEIKGGRWMRVFRAAQLTIQYTPHPVDITLDCPLRDAVPPDRRHKYRRRVLQRQTLRRRVLLVVVANGPYYGGGYTVAPGARLNDGRLTVSIYRNFSKLELIRHFWTISYGRHHYSPKVETLSAREVRLESHSPLPVHVDGHPLGHCPVTLRAIPRALRVFAPAKAPPHPPGASHAEREEALQHHRRYVDTNAGVPRRD